MVEGIEKYTSTKREGSPVLKKRVFNGQNSSIGKEINGPH